MRRDLVDLIPKVAIQLSRIDDDRYVSEGLLADANPAQDTGSMTSATKDQSRVNAEPATQRDEQFDESSGTQQDVPTANGDDRDTRPHEHEGEDQGHELAKRSRGGGHTADDREAIIKSMLEKRDELNRRLKEALSTGVVPDEGLDAVHHSEPDFQSDKRYREAVMAYEKQHGRFPQLKDESEAGHDIDSFVQEEGSLGSKLVRRIEVKGKGVRWQDSEIVELSDRQYIDAMKRAVKEPVVLAEDFDYWLYVVEDDGAGILNVLPIRNPSKRAAHYEFRAGTWRHLVEPADEQAPEAT